MENKIINEILKENAEDIILLCGASADNFKSGVVLPSIIPIEKLNILVDSDDNYIYPDWLSELMQAENKLLIIDSIDKLDKQSQLKFLGLIKLRQISGQRLPKDTQIIITAKSNDLNLINDQIKSLSIIIKD